jgi:hypothetical protein
MGKASQEQEEPAAAEQEESLTLHERLTASIVDRAKSQATATAAWRPVTFFDSSGRATVATRTGPATRPSTTAAEAAAFRRAWAATAPSKMTI